MSPVLSSETVRRSLVLALALVVGLIFGADAEAFHRRRVVVTYGPGYVSPALAGPSSFNPVGFGFGGYSYGGYPYYGYWGFMPGPYEGFSAYGPGAGPFYGQVAYNAYAAAGATGLDATAAASAPSCPGLRSGIRDVASCVSPVLATLESGADSLCLLGRAVGSAGATAQC